MLEYDDVANDQRKVIYQQRSEILEDSDVSAIVVNMREAVLGDLVDQFIPPGSMEEMWDIPGLEKLLESEYLLEAPVGEWLKAEPTLDVPEIRERILKLAEDIYAAKVALAGEEGMRKFEHSMLLQMLDTNWREHLAAMSFVSRSVFNAEQGFNVFDTHLFEQMGQKLQANEVVLASYAAFCAQAKPDAGERVFANRLLSDNHQIAAMNALGLVLAARPRVPESV